MKWMIFTFMMAFMLIFPSFSADIGNYGKDEIIQVLPAMDGRKLYVGGSGDNNYTTINSAVNNASDGDTIIIYPGIYDENVVISKSIKLMGKDRENVIVEGNYNGSTFRVEAEDVEIENVTVYGVENFTSSIFLNSSRCSIHDCILSSAEEGIHIHGHDNEVRNCHIEKCSMAGILVNSCERNKIESSSISNTLYGIMLYYSSNNSIKNCNLSHSIIFMDGNKKEHFIHEIKNCYIEHKPIIYHKNEDGFNIDNYPAGEIIISNCKNFKISDVKMEKDSSIEIFFGMNGKIDNCTLNGGNGIIVHHSSRINIENSVISGCSNGITLLFSSFNRIYNCELVNEGGIMIWQSPFNVVHSCKIEGTINPLSMFGMLSYGNKIIYNDFINNSWNPVFVNSIHNLWMRNYWDNWHVLLPRPIFGIIGAPFLPIPWIQIDWLPRLKAKTF